MYRTIDASFWTDPKVKKLPTTAKLLFLYLVTNTHSHVSGIYYLPMVTTSYETGIATKVLDTLCNTLSGAGLIRFDTKMEVVWIKNMFRYQGRGEKNARAAANHIAGLHNSSLVQEFLLYYPDVARFHKDRVSIPYPAQDESGTQDQDQEQEQEQEQSNTPLTPKGGDRARRTSAAYSTEFEAFWKAYPRKEGKGEAWKVWDRAVAVAHQLRDTTAADAMAWLTATAAAFAASPAGQGGRFVPHAATWLNKRRFEDDQREWHRSDRTGTVGSGPGQTYRGSESEPDPLA